MLGAVVLWPSARGPWAKWRAVWFVVVLSMLPLLSMNLTWCPTMQVDLWSHSVYTTTLRHWMCHPDCRSSEAFLKLTPVTLLSPKFCFIILVIPVYNSRWGKLLATSVMLIWCSNKFSLSLSLRMLKLSFSQCSVIALVKSSFLGSSVVRVMNTKSFSKSNLVRERISTCLHPLWGVTSCCMLLLSFYKNLIYLFLLLCMWSISLPTTAWQMFFHLWVIRCHRVVDFGDRVWRSPSNSILQRWSQCLWDRSMMYPMRCDIA